MSDTPRMDASAYEDDGVIWNTGRELERELAAANAEIEEKRKDIVYLATEKAKLEERIKRMEEAGDALYEAWHGYGFTKDNHLAAWLKAKESKL